MTRTRRRAHEFASPARLEAFLERELGREVVEQLHVCSNGLTMPVPIMGVGASAFRGTIIPRKAPKDFYMSMLRRKSFFERLKGERGGFASLSDLIAEATTGGKRQDLRYEKTSTVAASAAGATQSLWNVGALPAAGANAAAAPGGTVPDRTSTGSLGQQNPAGADTLHLTTWTGVSTVSGGLLLYDRLFGVLVSEATASNAVTEVTTRYTGVAGTNQYPAGSFIASRVTTVRAATTPTVTITYKDEDNSAAEAGAAVALRSSAAVAQTVWTPPSWTYPLNAGDQGLRDITNITYSTTSTGVTEFEIGHPIAILPAMAANIPFVLDGINSAFNLHAIESGACLAFHEFFKTATAVQTYAGMIEFVSG